MTSTTKNRMTSGHFATLSLVFLIEGVLQKLHFTQVFCSSSFFFVISIHSSVSFECKCKCVEVHFTIGIHETKKKLAKNKHHNEHNLFMRVFKLFRTWALEFCLKQKVWNDLKNLLATTSGSLHRLVHSRWPRSLLLQIIFLKCIEMPANKSIRITLKNRKKRRQQWI